MQRYQNRRHNCDPQYQAPCNQLWLGFRSFELVHDGLFCRCSVCLAESFVHRAQFRADVVIFFNECVHQPNNGRHARDINRIASFRPNQPSTAARQKATASDEVPERLGNHQRQAKQQNCRTNDEEQAVRLILIAWTRKHNIVQELLDAIQQQSCYDGFQRDLSLGVGRFDGSQDTIEYYC